jgi:hypothetical protein
MDKKKTNNTDTIDRHLQEEPEERNPSTDDDVFS